MNNDMIARQLHGKAAQGIILTREEQSLLATWYEQQDADEEALLSKATPQTTITLQSLRSEVEASATRLLAVTQYIQRGMAENEALRQEITKLTEQLERTPPLQTA